MQKMSRSSHRERRPAARLEAVVWSPLRHARAEKPGARTPVRRSKRIAASRSSSRSLGAAAVAERSGDAPAPPQIRAVSCCAVKCQRLAMRIAPPQGATLTEKPTRRQPLPTIRVEEGTTSESDRANGNGDTEITAATVTATRYTTKCPRLPLGHHHHNIHGHPRTPDVHWPELDTHTQRFGYTSGSVQFSRYFFTTTMNWSATAPSIMRWS